jgi:hypothetical protein
LIVRLVPSDGAETSAPRAERPDPLSAALNAAKKAATSVIALKWSSGGLKASELPPELVTNRIHLAIYLLPRAFAALDCPVASEFAELWLFGNSKKRRIDRVKQIQPKPDLPVSRFQIAEFGKSPTITNVVELMLKTGVATLPQMAGAEYALDSRWANLRAIAQSVAKGHRNKDQWSQPGPGFEGKILDPDILTEIYPITRGTYLMNGESPLSSDAYGALGDCAARAYLETVLSKKSGDDRIFVRPTRVGVRIWDDYNFTDDPGHWSAKLLSKVLPQAVSQFLGSWEDAGTGGEPIILQNSDFQSFREKFKPIYNNQKPSPERPLVCQDFSPVSHFATRAVEGGAEYPLWGIRT